MKVSSTHSKMHVPTIFKSLRFEYHLPSLHNHASCPALRGSFHNRMAGRLRTAECRKFFTQDAVLSLPAIFIPHNNDTRCHGIEIDARVTSQWILVLGPFSHMLSQIYPFLVEASHAKSFPYRCQTWRRFWTRKLSLEGYSIVFRGVFVISYFSVFL